MAQPRCVRQKLSLGRRMMTDALYFSRPHYISTGERRMRLADVIAARQQVSAPPSWAAIMTKAFALAAACFIGLWLHNFVREWPRGLTQRGVIALIVAWLFLATSWLRANAQSLSSSR